MKWLFFFLVFNVSGAQLIPKLRATAVFATEAECDSLGREFQKKIDYEDPNLRSFSTCIPQAIYSGPLGKVETVTF